MRKITEIIIHCSATREGRDFTVADIDGWHRARGFAGIGYHYVVYRDGTIAAGRPEEMVGAHTLGHNRNSIGICYIGGLDSSGRPKDTRTPEQRKALRGLTKELKGRYPGATIHGHREFAAKACPGFDVAGELLRGLLPSLVILILLLASCSSHRVATSGSSEFSETSELSEMTATTATTELLSMEADSVRRVVEYRDSGRRRVEVRIYAPRLGRTGKGESRISEVRVEEKAAAALTETKSEEKPRRREPRTWLLIATGTILALGIERVLKLRKTKG